MNEILNWWFRMDSIVRAEILLIVLGILILLFVFWLSLAGHRRMKRRLRLALHAIINKDRNFADVRVSTSRDKATMAEWYEAGMQPHTLGDTVRITDSLVVRPLMRTRDDNGGEVWHLSLYGSETIPLDALTLGDVKSRVDHGE